MAGHGGSGEVGGFSHGIASSSKKVPLLPSPPKVKKEPKTYVFELELRESNDQSYPEFSWAELVKADKAKEKLEKQKVQIGKIIINMNFGTVNQLLYLLIHISHYCCYAHLRCICFRQ